jgi:hypothetical protein
LSGQTLQLFDDCIWIIDGTEVDVAGFRYPTRMIVIRLENGDLFLWSPVSFTEELSGLVKGLGRVRHLVAPNSLHHLFLDGWQRAFPDARLYAPPGLRQRRSDLEFDSDLGNESPPEWAQEIEQVVVGGNSITTEVVFFHRRSRTTIFADLIQQFPPGWFAGWRALVARADLMVADQPTVPRKFRFAFIDRSAARAAVRRILAWPSDKVLMAHGPPIEHGGRAVIQGAFRWLKM